MARGKRITRRLGATIVFADEAGQTLKPAKARTWGRRGKTYGSRIPEGWQYSSRAKVPGAPYICDVNAWRMTFAQLMALLLGTGQAGRRATAQPDL